MNGFGHVIDPDGSIWAAYDILSQPSFAFLNNDGTTETHLGPLGVDGLSQRIDNLLTT